MTSQLDTLYNFPLTIQWRKVWEATKQYVKNDAVVSPSDRAVYILLTTSELEGDDPAVNSNWFPITSATSGVSNIEATDGLKNSGTGTNAIIDNFGVRTIRAGSNISITGTANNPVINGTASIPRFCLVFNAPPSSITGFPAVPSSAGVLTYGTSTSALFIDYMANGAPDANGAFYIDFSSLNFYKIGNSASKQSSALLIGIRDTTLNLTYTISRQFNSLIQGNQGYVSMGVIGFNIAVVRAAGLREVNAFVFTVGATGTNLNYTLISAGPIKAVYSPTG